MRVQTPLHRTVSSAAPILTASHIMVAVSTGIFTGMIASITSSRTAQPSAALRCRGAPPIDNARKTRKARRQQSATRMRYPRGAAPEVPARCGHLCASTSRSAQSSGHPPVDATLWVRISSHASASPALCGFLPTKVWARQADSIWARSSGTLPKNFTESDTSCTTRVSVDGPVRGFAATCSRSK